MFEIHRLAASESVQYFQFDSAGNMYVYEPGSGFSGPSVMVNPGFEMSEVSNLCDELVNVTQSSSTLSRDVFSMSEVSQAISSIDSKTVDSTKSKRY